MRDVAKVLAANEAFYAAFAARDVAAMEALWAQQAPVACIHPGWQPLHGREAVLASWRDIMSSPTSPPIRCAEPTAHVLGTMAMVICSERFPGAELVATNVFIQEGGEWKLVHHQAGGVARPSGSEDEGETVH